MTMSSGKSWNRSSSLLINSEQILYLNCHDMKSSSIACYTLQWPSQSESQSNVAKGRYVSGRGHLQALS